MILHNKQSTVSSSLCTHTFRSFVSSSRLSPVHSLLAVFFPSLSPLLARRPHTFGLIWTFAGTAFASSQLSRDTLITSVCTTLIDVCTDPFTTCRPCLSRPLDLFDISRHEGERAAYASGSSGYSQRILVVRSLHLQLV